MDSDWLDYQADIWEGLADGAGDEEDRQYFERRAEQYRRLAVEAGLDEAGETEGEGI